MIRTILAVFLLIVVAGCATTTPGPQLYLLGHDNTAPPAQSPNESTPNLALADIEIAGFLDQSGIVYQTAPNKISVASRHLWAESLPAQIRRNLHTTLASTVRGVAVFPQLRAAPERSVRLSVEFTGFHGRYDGQAIVAGVWLLAAGADQALLRQPFSYRVALNNDGYDELVRALAEGLNTAAREMAVAVNRYTARETTTSVP